MMNLGYNNLQNLLLEKEIHSNSSIRKIGNLVELVSENSIWPNGFYYFSNDQSNNEIEEALVPESDLIFILESDINKINFRTLGFRAADIWYSMFLDLDKDKYQDVGGIVQLIPIQSTNDLLVWKQHTERIFFNNFTISDSFLLSLLGVEKFSFLNFFVGTEVVGTALVYFSGEDAGLYFFAIHEDYRKNGFGYRALDCICNFVVQKGASKLMLQSTRQGKDLYSRSGFQLEDRIHLYKRR
jgi:N-acetylglutamate synthase-like GNAT family acetyltransferase